MTVSAHFGGSTPRPRTSRSWLGWRQCRSRTTGRMEPVRDPDQEHHRTTEAFFGVAERWRRRATAEPCARRS